MKSEFLLAFNEICQERGLPQETVIEALKTALVSAYRRNANVSNTQDVRVEIDPRTGDPTIYAEKEVVDSIIDNRTEVLLDVAKRGGFPEAEYGDMVMVDSTPRNFGRIAAQTAKQVILQRVREAEREQLYDDFASREGEIVNGTVQSVSGQNITIGLGRTEALLPRSQQVQSERYRPHDKIRVYVLEVRRTSRGPQIFVSRNHRNLLRRLLELEVPEIYNGQVDIKSIAREAGQRSKVAVVALQPGVDPVGACVGMRGVRIQSIVRELNDEKIDVIEWDSNQRNFIAKALSPARVSSVYLEEHPDNGKTAVVIVPDDQLSLAIGREGQNARLAAKLTGWRIDIKSLTEAANDSLKLLDHADADQKMAADTGVHDQVRIIIEKKAAGRPITAEDYKLLEALVDGIEGRIIRARAEEYDQIRKDRAELRKLIPDGAWEVDLEEFNLMHRSHAQLVKNGIDTVGEALYQLQLGDDKLLAIDGIGDKALEELKKSSKAWLVAYHRKVKIDAELAAQAAAKAAAEAAEDEGQDEAVVASADAAVTPAPVEVEEEDIDFEEAIAEGYSDFIDEDEEEDEYVGEVEVEATVEADAEVEVEADAETDTEVETEVEAVAEAEAEAETEAEAEAEAEVEADVVAEAETESEIDTEAEVVEADAEAEGVVDKVVIGDEVVPVLEPLLPEAETAAEEEKPEEDGAAPVVVVRTPAQTKDAPDDSTGRGKRRKGRELVFDEDAGRVIAKRKRKGSRRRNDWEEFEDF